jgi:hypothetical protein
MPAIKEILARPVALNIEEVIKVDQNDADIIKSEIEEYVMTDSILDHFLRVLDRYQETPANPHEGIGIWVSGFFGSGKSSFAKLLGLALANREILGEGAAARLASRRPDSKKLQVFLKQITEKIPADAVIFDVSTDRGIRDGNQSMTEIMHKCFVRSLGYADSIDLTQLEIDLESEGQLDTFKAKYHEVFKKDWDAEKAKLSFALSQASRVMSVLEPATYPAADSWVKAAQNCADVTPGILAERGKTLMARRRPGHTLVFVVDEVGQFVARDVQKMLDLQALVQGLGRVGRGKMWLIVTSQEKLTELVGGLDDRRVELARLMDRFPLQVHLEPSDISEVTSRRILSKNAAGETLLRKQFEIHRGRLSTCTTVTAEYRLPELTAESFIRLYPLLPYQVELIINVVSGLRTQGGASRHVGGANRTIIKLAQQLLIHQDVALAEAEVGALVRIDQIYDLVSGNISSDLKGKISGIAAKVPHPFAEKVAKAICLLQFVRTFHRTPENIAACLHQAIDADSCVTQVKEALDLLEKAKQVRLGEDGYRIPSPAEDDWERLRDGVTPKPADSNETLRETVLKLWSPTPGHNLLGVKLFKAGLFLNERVVVDGGDVPFYLTLAPNEAEFTQAQKDLRTRSQSETKHVFWAARLNEKIDHHALEYFRSKEILKAKERGARTQAEISLVGEEKRRQTRYADDLRRLLREAILAGSIYFRGNDRSPEEGSVEVSKVAEVTLAKVIPEIFDRFEEAAARVTKGDLDAVLTVTNLHGLPPVFTSLDLLRTENGQTVFKTDTNPLLEVFTRIQNRVSYGETATGRYLVDDFDREPFGWDFEVVRLFVACLLRAGQIDVTSQGKLVESALSVDARNLFSNNNTFRAASFRPKQAMDFVQLVRAAENFKEVFGAAIQDISSPDSVATAIRAACMEPEEDLSAMHTILVSNGLPGASVLQQGLDQAKVIRNTGNEQTILTFNGAYKQIKEAIKRASDLAAQLTEPNLVTLHNARTVLHGEWSFLKTEADLAPKLEKRAEELADLLARETFYQSIPLIGQHAGSLRSEHKRLHSEASAQRSTVYAQAIAKVKSNPGWDDIALDQKQRLLQPLAACEGPAPATHAIPLIRADVDACPGRTQKVIEEIIRLIDGSRIVRLEVGEFFPGAIENQEQLDAALSGLREACEQQIGEGKKVFIQ